MLNDIKDTLFSALDSAQKQGEKVAHISALRLKAMKLSKKISLEYKNLGMLVYECHMSNIKDDGIISTCIEKIASLRRELTVLNREIDTLCGIVSCDFCSHKNKKEQTVCEKCGESLEKEQPANEDIDAIKNEIAQIRQNIKDLTEN